MNYHAMEIKEVLSSLKTNEKGLTSEDAKLRLEKYGRNEIEEKEGIHPFFIFINQFKSIIVWILIIAVIISMFIGEMVDAVVILIILLLNALFGFIQEYKAEKAIEALKKMASLKAAVIRDGRQINIDTHELVPGDIIILETGEKIPADARMIELVNLQTQEAPLTGESLPVKKTTRTFAEKIGIADRKNMVFSGTIITRGRGKAVVTGTGMTSEIGKIAHMIQRTEKEATPLQKKLGGLGKWLGLITIVIAAIVFLQGVIMQQGSMLDFFIVAVALAVAAIPEGLPAVVTISLALGVKRMVKRNALIRKLPSVETLGSTTVICTDKTGTLTRNEMTVKKIYVDERIINIAGSGYNPEGAFSVKTESLKTLLKAGVLCNDSSHYENERGEWQIVGDPTEGALLVSAAKAEIKKESLEKESPRIGEIEFSSERKRMSTIHKIKNKEVVFVKGAPDIILDLCNWEMHNGKIRRLSKQRKQEILKANEQFAGQALRVLGFAYKDGKDLKKQKEGDIEKDLTFIGLQGMIDPPRKEVKDSILKCEKAGIKIIMITGDFKGTAVAIADELGIKGKAVTGQDIEKLDLDKHVEDIAVYARVNPEHKLKIVEALKKKGHVVAMTGDGVNDAPALKKADIGVSMGITGTDVAKEASDMILTDDNFISIVNAIEEGRSIYDNIKKFINYLLSSNLAEVMVIFIAGLILLPLPLLAIQLLWINLITDGLPALALGVDPASPGIMERKPRKPKESIMSKGFIINLLFIGALITIATLFSFKHGLFRDINTARTFAFTTLVVLEIARIQMIRSNYHVGLFSNKWLLGALASSILLQVIVIYPPLNRIFETVPLGLLDWGFLAAVAVAVYIVGWAGMKFVNKITHEEG